MATTKGTFDKVTVSEQYHGQPATLHYGVSLYDAVSALRLTTRQFGSLRQDGVLATVGERGRRVIRVVEGGANA